MNEKAQRGSRRISVRVGMALLAAATSAPMPAEAVLRYVANNGTDSGNPCTSDASPCRTISRALSVALPFDTIRVRPGIYGDADGDGLFATAGHDEMSGTPSCAVAIHVPVTIQSVPVSGTTTQTRSTATVITGGGANVHLVCIFAPSVYFRGFTLTRNAPGTAALVVHPGADSARVEQNIAAATGSGFVLEAQYFRLEGNRALATGGSGFVLAGDPARVIRNVSMDNAEHGFYIAPSMLVAGFAGNVAGGNRGAGILVDVGATLFKAVKNQLLGNRSHGIRLEAGADLELFLRNNIYGNGTDPLLPLANCGLLNDSGTSINVGRNHWGAPLGPGADPADDICDLGLSSTVFSPLAPPSAVSLTTFR